MSRRPRTRRSLIFRWIGLVVIVAVLATGGYAVYSYLHFTSGITHIDAIANKNAAYDTTQNILLVGDDHRPAGATAAQLAQMGTQEDGGGTNTDTMMVLHIPADGKKATLVSFPRDSWVNVPGYGMNKLNAAFELGAQNGGDTAGARLLITTIQNMSGLRIDHFVRVSMLGFYSIAEALGPIQVCLNAAVNDPYSTLVLPAGVSTLNAQQALAFVRQRHGLPGGDLDREKRQQYFLSIEAHRLLAAGTLLNPVKLQNVLSAVSSSIETDPGLNLLSLAAQLHGLTGNNITAATIPVSGTPTIDVNGTELSIVQVDTAAMPAFIAGIEGTSSASAYAKAKAAKVSAVTVTVLNGGDVNGAAAAATGSLDTIGFTTTTPGSTDTQATTTIEYPKGMESAAKALAAHVAGAAVAESTTVKGVTLVLGTDGLGVGSSASSTASSSASSGSATISGNPAGTKSYTPTSCVN